MKLILLFILYIIFIDANSQTTKKNIYNFQTDYYWDSTLYKSSLEFYYEIKKNKIYESNYPVKVYQNSKIIKDTPLKIKDIYVKDNIKYVPYFYKKIKDSISIVFFNYEKNMFITNFNYFINTNDSDTYVLDKSNLICQNSKNILSKNGKSKFLGIRTVFIKNDSIHTYCFEENHKTINEDVRFYYITEVYIDTLSLIPIQFISRQYNMKDIYTNYFSITKINTITNSIPNYKFQKDLILFEDKSLNWTQKQRDSFLQNYTSDTTNYENYYINCLLALLDGQVSFYNFDSSPIFKSIVSNSKCD